MLSFDSLRVDLTGWTPHKREGTGATWYDRDGDVLMVDLFPAPPDLPRIADGPDELRDFFRRFSHASGQGLVEADVIEPHGIRCARLIIKSRLQPAGFGFLGTIVVPRRDFSFVIRVQALERGMTGMRETAVMMLAGPNPAYEPPDPDAPKVQHPIFGEVIPSGKMKGWFKDPYDARFDDLALRTLADDEKYDASMPAHPLSRTRRKLRALVDSLAFDASILEAEPFLVPVDPPVIPGS